MVSNSNRDKDRARKPEYAVIGLNRFGASVALTLVEHSYTVLGADRDREAVQDLSELLTHAVVLDSTDEAALHHVDITLYDAVVVAIGDDFESKVITALLLKQLGVRRIICSALSDRERTILLKIGVDEVVMPDVDSGRRLAQRLMSPTIVERFNLGGSYAVSEVRLPDSMAGRSAQDADAPAAFGLTLIAVRRGDDLTISPGPDVVLQQGDLLTVIGKSSDIERFVEMV